MKIIFKKKCKINKIKKMYKYFYIFRYDNITTNELILIKKKLKKEKLKSLIIKKNIIKEKTLPFNIQGCILLIYTNNFFNIKKLFFFNKIKFQAFFNKKLFYSNLKYQKILNNSDNKLQEILVTRVLLFFYLLKKIIRVNIT